MLKGVHDTFVISVSLTHEIHIFQTTALGNFETTRRYSKKDYSNSIAEFSGVSDGDI